MMKYDASLMDNISRGRCIYIVLLQCLTLIVQISEKCQLSRKHGWSRRLFDLHFKGTSSTLYWFYRLQFAIGKW